MKTYGLSCIRRIPGHILSKDSAKLTWVQANIMYLPKYRVLSFNSILEFMSQGYTGLVLVNNKAYYCTRSRHVYETNLDCLTDYNYLLMFYNHIAYDMSGQNKVTLTKLEKAEWLFL